MLYFHLINSIQSTYLKQSSIPFNNVDGAKRHGEFHPLTTLCTYPLALPFIFFTWFLGMFLHSAERYVERYASFTKLRSICREKL